MAPTERVAFGMTTSFAIAVLTARGISYGRERRARVPVVRSVARRALAALPSPGPRIHHFVPGIAIALAAGAAGIGLRGDASGVLLSVPFGVGSALVCDEIGLLIDLDNPYWGREQLALAQAGAAAVIAGAVAAHVVSAGRRSEVPHA